MIQSLWTAASGLLAQQTRVDTISSNIANVNTTGFKRDVASFSDLIYSRMRPTEQTTNLGQSVPAGLDRGHGVRISGIRKEYGQGMMETTGRDLDFAIQGDGFFSVRLADGTTGYTRTGDFRVDSSGTIVTSAGNALLAGNAPMVVPDGATDLNVAEDGTVSVIGPDDNLVVLGRIGLTRFADPSSLTSVGSGICVAGPEAGLPEAVVVGDSAAVVQGALERSNVDVAQEMVALVLAQRAYEMSSRAVQTADQMIGMANNLRR